MACDEQCKREKAMADNGIQFPEYLTSRYCRDISVDFLMGTRNSLQEYRDERLERAHRGGMRNIRNFIEQRKEWLKECDQYLMLTGQGRIFRNAETTEKIFSAMDTVSKELQDLVNGLVYFVQGDGKQTDVAAQKFEALFHVVDEHKTDLQLRGQLVIR
jgi:hypothetical protein